MCRIRIQCFSMIFLLLSVLSASCTENIEDMANNNKDNISNERQRATQIEQDLWDKLNDARERIKALESELGAIERHFDVNDDNHAQLQSEINDVKSDVEHASLERQNLAGKISNAEFEVSNHSTQIEMIKTSVKSNAGQIYSNTLKVDGANEKLDVTWDIAMSNTNATNNNANDIHINSVEITGINERLKNWYGGTLHVWDGAGELLGQLISMTKNTYLYYDERIAMPVEVSTQTQESQTTGTGELSSVLLYETTDCTGDAYVEKQYTTYNIAYLDQNTGKLFVLGGARTTLEIQSKRLISGQGSCQPISGFFDVSPVEEVGEINPFTKGIVVAPDEWVSP